MIQQVTLKGEIEKLLSFTAVNNSESMVAGVVTLEVIGDKAAVTKDGVIQGPKVYVLCNLPSLKHCICIAKPSFIRGWPDVKDLCLPQIGEFGFSILIDHDVPEAYCPL